jgi:hypothetical protein
MIPGISIDHSVLCQGQGRYAEARQCWIIQWAVAATPCAERRARPVSRAGRFRDAVSRMVDKPEHVAATRSIPGRIVAAAGSAMATIAAKKLVAHELDGILERLQRGPGPQPAPPHPDASVTTPGMAC